MTWALGPNATGRWDQAAAYAFVHVRLYISCYALSNENHSHVLLAFIQLLWMCGVLYPSQAKL